MAGRCRSLAVAAALMSPLAAWAADETALVDALSSGTATASVRYRYEQFDLDNIAEKANASTARLRLNYRTAAWQQWSAFVEFDHVFHVLARDFNSGAGTSPGRSQYPVVADPSGSDLNQIYLDYAVNETSNLRFGRQRILLDNHRFVGNVGWRQNEQTYDALTFASDAIRQTHFSYSYINYVRRIFGEDVPAGKDRLDGHLLNAKVTINKDVSLVPYVYYLDYDDAASAANSTATYGIRLNGQVAAAQGSLRVTAEVATQSDVGNNPVNYDADYYHVDLLWSRPRNLGFGFGIESLGGATTAGRAFRTPLATLHAFQGWADQFLTTPSAGIDDIYASLNYAKGDWKLSGIYHDFSAESGSGDYGSEIDLSANWNISSHYALLFKAAVFSGETPAFPDATKFWLQFSASYP